MALIVQDSLKNSNVTFDFLKLLSIDNESPFQGKKKSVETKAKVSICSPFNLIWV